MIVKVNSGINSAGQAPGASVSPGLLGDMIPPAIACKGTLSFVGCATCDSQSPSRSYSDQTRAGGRPMVWTHVRTRTDQRILSDQDSRCAPEGRPPAQ